VAGSSDAGGGGGRPRRRRPHLAVLVVCVILLSLQIPSNTPSAAQTYRPSIGLWPGVGSPGERVTVSGADWEAWAASYGSQLMLFFDYSPDDSSPPTEADLWTSITLEEGRIPVGTTRPIPRDADPGLRTVFACPETTLDGSYCPSGSLLYWPVASFRVLTLDASPDEVEHGARMTASGDGFGSPTECGDLVLELGGVRVASTGLSPSTSAGFRFTESFTVPDSVPTGRVTLTASQRGCELFASVTVRVTQAPQLVVDPEQGTIGDEVEASGVDFLPATAVRLKIEDEELTTVPASEVSDDGSFDAALEIPEAIPGGEREIVACQLCDTDEERAGVATFLVVPRIETDRDIAPRGAVIEAIGDGFPEGVATDLHWDRGIGFATVTADETGRFNVPMLIFRRDIVGPRLLLAEFELDDEEPVTLSVEFVVAPGTMAPPQFTGRG